MRRAVFMAMLVPFLNASAYGAEPRGQSFVDDFDKLDAERWYISDGWTNGAHQNCLWSKEQISVGSGVLALSYEAKTLKDQDYACAELQSRQRFGYGTFEARIRTPEGSGLNAAFFTYIGTPADVPHDEIDFEFLLKDTSRVQVNTYVQAKGGNEFLAALPAPSNAAFQDYAFKWEPSRLRFYVGGKLVHTINDPAKIPTHPGKIFFSLWSTGTLTQWLGPFEPPIRPVAMEVDRVAYTALHAPCQFAGSIACGEAR